ncbi:MAG: hypothetical protein IIA88_02415 [Bacteroidetes bacterium]|nr:hypothetical protein [Bacteroidota bacterium]
MNDKIKIKLELFRTYFYLLLGLTAGTVGILLPWIDKTNSLYHNKIVSYLLVVGFSLIVVAFCLFIFSLGILYRDLKK